MFLSAYHFDGDPAVLAAAHDRLLSAVPPEQLLVHVCVTTGRGITVFDACPSRDVFEAFHVSPEFRAAVTMAGLPQPRVEPVGEVHAIRVDPVAVAS